MCVRITCFKHVGGGGRGLNMTAVVTVLTWIGVSISAGIGVVLIASMLGVQWRWCQTRALVAAPAAYLPLR